MANILYLKGRNKPYTLIINESVLDYWLKEGYVEHWPERDTAEDRGFKKKDSPPRVETKEGN